MTDGPTAASVVALYPAQTSLATDRAHAAVLAVLRDGPEGVEVLLIERAESDDDPASGQIGLPGGHVEPTDASLAETAERECGEETGISGRDIKGPPRFVLVSHALSSRVRVAVFTAELTPAGAVPTARDPTEVASVFWMPRAAFATMGVAERETSVGLRRVPAVRFGKHVVWGFTLRVVRVLFGFEPLPTAVDTRPFSVV